MKRTISVCRIIITAQLVLSCSSCSLFGLHTTSELKKAQAASYRKGHSNGTASEVRAQYHREQRKKEQPLPPLEKKYYHVPMGGYQTPDGLWIEPHKAIVEIVQP